MRHALAAGLDVPPRDKRRSTPEERLNDGMILLENGMHATRPANGRITVYDTEGEPCIKLMWKNKNGWTVEVDEKATRSLSSNLSLEERLNIVNFVQARVPLLSFDSFELYGIKEKLILKQRDTVIGPLLWVNGVGWVEDFDSSRMNDTRLAALNRCIEYLNQHYPNGSLAGK